MKRLKLLILVFVLALSIPLAYLVLRTYWSLEQEELGELRYFAEAIFDRMEDELADLVRREEARPVDEYRAGSPGSAQGPGASQAGPSPLSSLPKDEYILGYLQNNPDGSLQTPLDVGDPANASGSKEVVATLRQVNRSFNVKRTLAPEPPEARLKTPATEKKDRQRPSTFADKYLDMASSKEQRAILGQVKTRLEEITAEQAKKVAALDRRKSKLADDRSATLQPGSVLEAEAVSEDQSWIEKRDNAPAEHTVLQTEAHQAPASSDAESPGKLKAELDPLQSVFIDDTKIFVFRRIVINNEIYRQGFVLLVPKFLEHLVQAHFAGQPMSRFTQLHLKAVQRGRESATMQAGAIVDKPQLVLDRAFPRPFSFLHASLSCRQVPRSVGRGTLNFMMMVLAAIVLAGLFAIYRSARAVVELSERRSQFVSSVTHELKTPLTTIRMYVEMLEQGIAQTREREQEYFSVLGSESVRLSRLIDNVLEFSRLERRQRRANLKEGSFQVVFQEVEAVMREKLRQEGFTLHMQAGEVAPFRYDPEMMIQVLINLIDNSVKFGKDLPTREITLRLWAEPRCTKISVSDTGPGIPRRALKKVFDDFYRADDDRARATTGTGIGLALVKRLVRIMGGTVRAANNQGPGCTITVSLPSHGHERG